MGIFQRLNVERGITVLLITHERDIAEYATRIIACRDGLIVSDHPVTDAPLRRRRAQGAARRNRRLTEHRSGWSRGPEITNGFVNRAFVFTHS